MRGDKSKRFLAENAPIAWALRARNDKRNLVYVSRSQADSMRRNYTPKPSVTVYHAFQTMPACGAGRPRGGVAGECRGPHRDKSPSAFPPCGPPAPCEKPGP